MSKIKIKTTIATKEECIEQIYNAIYQEQEEIILYQEQDEENTLTKYEYKTQQLTRENRNMHLIYPFQKDKITYAIINIKELNQTIKLEIKTKNIIKKGQNIKINYLLENKEYQYKIEVI